MVLFGVDVVWCCVVLCGVDVVWCCVVLYGVVWCCVVSFVGLTIVKSRESM